METLQDVVEALEGIEEGMSEDAGALTLLSSVVVGPNADRIAGFTGLPRSTTRTIGSRLRQNNIWQGSKICCDWFGEHGGIRFMCDVCCANGLLERR